MSEQISQHDQHGQRWLSQTLNLLTSISDWDPRSVIDDVRRASQINAHWRSLRVAMMSYAGIIRATALTRCETYLQPYAMNH